MKVAISYLAVFVILAGAVTLALGIRKNNTHPRPSTEAIKRDLLAVVPDLPNYETGEVTTLNKTTAYFASLRVETSDKAARNRFELTILKNGWRKLKGEPHRPLVFCKLPMVLEVSGPTMLDGERDQYLLASSWGSYFAFCE